MTMVIAVVTTIDRARGDGGDSGNGGPSWRLDVGISSDTGNDATVRAVVTQETFFKFGLSPSTTPTPKSSHLVDSKNHR